MTSISTEEHDRLKHLEESLWRAETRFDRAYMEHVLAPDFFEFGRSGRVYKREHTLNVPAEPEIDAKLLKFEARMIEANVALVTYVSEVTYDDVTEVANRSSIWTRDAMGWKIRFHQGTPVSGA